MAKSLSAFLQRAMSAVFCVRTQREVRTVTCFSLASCGPSRSTRQRPTFNLSSCCTSVFIPCFACSKSSAAPVSSSKELSGDVYSNLLTSKVVLQEISISLTNWENRTNSFNKKCSHISLCLILPLHNLPLLDLHRERGSALACEAERLGIPYMGITQDREAKSTQLAVSQYLKQYRDPKKVFLHVSSPCASGSQSAMEPKGVITFRSKKFDQPRKLWVKPCGLQQERGQTSCTLSPGWALLLRGLQKL